MSTGILEQLRIYGEDFDAGLPPVTLDELEDGLSKPVGTGAVRPLQPRRSIRPVRGWLVAAAAALAVLVLVGGAALLLQATESTTPVATTPPVETTSTTLVEAGGNKPHMVPPSGQCSGLRPRRHE